MLKFGSEPYLECSGDKRFSDARLIDGDSIEEKYQARKVFGSKDIEVRKYYSILWNVYFKQHPGLYDVIRGYNGFSDISGQEGDVCPAEEIYRIRMALGSTEKPVGAFK